MNTDIDECIEGLHTCVDETGPCVNTVGGFRCDCVSGYVATRDDLCEGNVRVDTSVIIFLNENFLAVWRDGIGCFVTLYVLFFKIR